MLLYQILYFHGGGLIFYYHFNLFNCKYVYIIRIYFISNYFLIYYISLDRSAIDDPSPLTGYLYFALHKYIRYIVLMTTINNLSYNNNNNNNNNNSNIKL